MIRMRDEARGRQGGFSSQRVELDFSASSTKGAFSSPSFVSSPQANHRPALFCGDEHPTMPGVICQIDPFHVGDHFCGTRGVHWAKVATQPAIKAAKPVERAPYPPLINGILPCYYCGKPADDIINEDVPVCRRHDARTR